MGFYFDQFRCIGCYTCSVACKDWNDIRAGPANWRRVISIEKGKYPNLFLAHLSISCNHCEKPACIMACPANAITKREEDGIVVVNREKCLGSGVCATLCKKACPYDAPQFEDEENAKMQKCNLCLDRLMENKKPICVTACPMRALDAGPMDELKAKYGDLKETKGFVYSAETKPAIIFRSRYK